MLTFIVIQYLAVALMGLFLLIKLFSGKPAKLVVGIIHGSVGLAGLALLLFYISFQNGDSPTASFLVILLAFFFGSGMLATTLSRKKYPKVILFIHIAIAITGIYLLISFWR